MQIYVEVKRFAQRSDDNTLLKIYFGSFSCLEYIIINIDIKLYI